MLGSTNPVVGDSFDAQEYLKSYQELKKAEDTRAGEKVIKYEGDEKELNQCLSGRIVYR